MEEETTTLSDLLTGIANSIREKEGTANPIPAKEMKDRILSIQTGVDTSDATATAGDILVGKTAYVNGQKVTGTLKLTGTLSVSATDVLLDYPNPAKLISVTRSGDGAITATSSDTSVATVSVSGTTLTISNVNKTNGSAIITVKVAASATHTAPADVQIHVTVKFATIYGVEWDWTSSGNTKGTRTDAAASFSDPNPAVSNGNGSSPFDNLMPWSGMVKETRTGGVMVKEPKYYFKWTKTGKKLKLQIADGPVDGFYVDPVNMDREDGLGELDFSYIGRYHCATSTYKSETNKAQQVNITSSAARTAIHNLGANYWQMDFAQMWYVGMLYLVEFADWNGQTNIGYGCSPSVSKGSNGQTDAMAYHTGTTAENRTTYGFTQYRNIEGWWDNVYDWMDGCYYYAGDLYVIKNPSQFSDGENGTFIGSPIPGIPNDMEISTQSGFEWVLYPSSRGGNETTYVSDLWNVGGTDPCLLHGGDYHQSLLSGLFRVDFADSFDANDYTGCRIQERPPKVA